jgi:lipoprotein-releasing system permease protein
LRSPAPFSRFEWMIAWRYLRARRSEGGVSVMTWISLVGIMLAVAALIITLAVRAGFRAEFVATILGANAHVTVYSQTWQTETGQLTRVIREFDALAEAIAEIPGVTRAAPLVRGQVMGTANGNNAGVEVFGIRAADLMTIPRVAAPEQSSGDIARFGDGVALGSGVARALGVGVGDRVRLISPSGVRTPFGTSPRVSEYEVVYVFTAGRYDIDRTRVYMPFAEAQLYFDREGVADEIEVMVDDPEQIRGSCRRFWRWAGR